MLLFVLLLNLKGGLQSCETLYELRGDPFFDLYTVVLLSCQNFTRGNSQVSGTTKSKMGLHCFFGLMFREISILLIHYSGNKIYYIAGMQSDRPVANMGSHDLFH